MRILIVATLVSIVAGTALATPPQHWISMRTQDGACIDAGYGDAPGDFARSIRRELHQEPMVTTLDDGTVIMGWWERKDQTPHGIPRATRFFRDIEHCLMLQSQMIKNGDLPGE